MKTDSNPLHGSYFDLLNDKYPDLRKPAAGRRPRRPPRLARGRHRPMAAGLLLATATIGVAWRVSSVRDLPVRPAPAAISASAEAPSRVQGPLATIATPVAPEPPAASIPAAGAGDEEATRRGESPDRRPHPPADAPLTPRLAAKSEPSSDEPARTSSAAPDAPPASPAPAPTAPPAAEPPPGYEPARKLYSPSPEYPLAARQAGEEGTVVVAARIDETGAVTSTAVVTGRSPALDQAAAEALAAWRFEPAVRNGRAIASSYRVGFEFALRPPVAGPARQETSSPESGQTSRDTRPMPLLVGGDVKPPRRLKTPLPIYPPRAWAEGVTGHVLVRAVIDEQGAVAEMEVLKGLPYGMTEAALEAIRRWRFSPATRDGRPVSVYRNLSVRFET